MNLQLTLFVISARLMGGSFNAWVVTFLCRAMMCALVLAPYPARAADGGALDSLRGAQALEGSTRHFDFGSLKGNAVIVTFFASWCPPCTTEFAEIAKARARLKNQPVKVVAINLFEAWGGVRDEARMERFIARTMPDFSLVVGNAEIAKAFGNVDRIPTLMVYSPSGKEVWRFVHVRDAKKTHARAAEIVAAVNTALAER